MWFFYNVNIYYEPVFFLKKKIGWQGNNDPNYQFNMNIFSKKNNIWISHVIWYFKKCKLTSDIV